MKEIVLRFLLKRQTMHTQTDHRTNSSIYEYSFKPSVYYVSIFRDITLRPRVIRFLYRSAILFFYIAISRQEWYLKSCKSFEGIYWSREYMVTKSWLDWSPWLRAWKIIERRCYQHLDQAWSQAQHDILMAEVQWKQKLTNQYSDAPLFIYRGTDISDAPIIS